MLVFTQGDTSAQPSCLDSLDLEILDDLEYLEIMADLVDWYACDNDDISLPLIGLEKIVGQSPAEILSNVQEMLEKRFGELMMGVRNRKA